jgi:hypothetical protein
VFFRRKAPLFRGSEGPVHEGLAPVELRCLIELREKRAPQIKPHVLALPFAEATPARRGTRILLGQVLPSSAGAKHPKDALEALPVIRRRPAASLAWLPLREVWLDLDPLLVGEALHDNDRSQPLIGRKISERQTRNRSI